MDLCKWCEEPIQKVVFAWGIEWAHFNALSKNPSPDDGTAWRYCKTTKAEPKEN